MPLQAYLANAQLTSPKRGTTKEVVAAARFGGEGRIRTYGPGWPDSSHKVATITAALAPLQPQSTV